MNTLEELLRAGWLANLGYSGVYLRFYVVLNNVGRVIEEEADTLAKAIEQAVGKATPNK